MCCLDYAVTMRLLYVKLYTFKYQAFRPADTPLTPIRLYEHF
jgi:hypothetical protein